MRGPLTTQNQNCYRELIEKEAYTRLAWKIKYGQEYPTRYASRRPKEPGLPKLPASKTTLPPVVKKEEAPTVPEARTEPQPAISSVPLMRPVTPSTRNVLYDGFSREGKGRMLYLQRRLHKSPEEKFEHAQLSSWEYGWRLGDYGRNYTSPFNGRSGIVRSTFYTRNGIFHIPLPTDRLA